MIFLLLSILTSTIILVIFRMFKRYEINTFQAIVFNYMVAFSIGFSLFRDDLKAGSSSDYSWIYFTLVVGVLFISLFNLMAKSSQENGIGVTSVVVKMSLAIPVVAAIVLYNESYALLKIAGIFLAILGVVLISYKKSDREKGKSVVWLFILFLGSGSLDVLLNYIEKNELEHLSPGLFSGFAFAVAGTIGLTILLVQLALKKAKFEMKNVWAGIVLGVPNYFSIYFLIEAIRSPALEDSTTYAFNNVGIVLASFLLGLLFFKEKINALKLVGLISAVLAIFLLVF
ncbi:MAG: SMR family transporter [Lishizhenia sp.]